MSGEVRFPIQRTVVEHGLDMEMILEEGDSVRCVQCGKAFEVRAEQVRVRITTVGHKSLDEYECVVCPHCGRVADAYYYVHGLPRELAEEPKRLRKKRISRRSKKHAAGPERTEP